MTRRAIQLPVPVTLSFLPYADDLPITTAAARAHGHEVFLHLPMEPIGSADPGPNAILVGLDPDEFNRRLSWAFERVPLATGLNNHMGSRATSEPESMLKVLQEVRRRGLNFVDSRTSPLSVGDGLAAQLGIPHAARDVFLDNNPAPAGILRQLNEAERLARRRGHALAIGHPYPTTLSVLETWLPAAEARGLKIVRASDLIAAIGCRQPAPLQVSACSGPDCPPRPGLLSRSAPAAGEADGLLGGADQGARLVAALLVLGLGVAVGDHAAARLDVHAPVLDQRGPQRDAGVHRAVGGEVADGTGVEAAPLGLQLVDDLHRPDLGRAADRAGREARPSARPARRSRGGSPPSTLETMCMTWL